jgi:hypothetical protein
MRISAAKGAAAINKKTASKTGFSQPSGQNHRHQSIFR